MGIHLEGRIASGFDLLDGDLRDLDLYELGGETWLAAVTGLAGGISLYRLSPESGISLSGSAYFAFSGLIGGTVSTVTLDGAPVLVLGDAAAGLVGYAPGPGGTPGPLVQTALPGAAGARPADLVAQALPDGRSALYTLDAGTGRIEAWRSDGAGLVTGRLGLAGDGAAYRLEGEGALALAGNGVLLALDGAGNGLRSYLANAGTGALSVADRLGAEDGLGIARPVAVETVTAHGGNWAILAGAGSHSLSVIAIGADGALTAADHLVDSRSTRFGGVQDIAVAEVGGHVFVLAGGADDGISLFTLLPGGRLLHLETLAHAAGLGLDNVAAIEAAPMGDALWIFVAAAGSAGITRFSVPLDGLGRVIEAGPGATRGTDADDTMLAGAGGGRLDGRAGDDILVSGPGGVLTGGAGADIFVPGPGAGPGTVRITDFTPGEDRLDLGGFAMLRSPGQLVLTETATGAILAFAGTDIRIESAHGGPLGMGDLFPSGTFAGPDRVLVANAPPGETGGGSDGADLLTGGPGDDSLSGGAGGDRIRGGAGDDTLAGGTGRDRIMGNAGADRIAGGDGHDRLFGGRHDDTIQGDDGNDRIKGGGGADRLAGGNGRDRIDGGRGHDQVHGFADDDILRGGRGRDTLTGGPGDDRLEGGSGADTLTGGPGDDVIEGGRGRDRLIGQDGADVFVFAARHGRDRIDDFTPGEDRIALDTSVSDMGGLRIEAIEGGSRLWTGGGVLDLPGVTPEQLDAGAFDFL